MKLSELIKQLREIEKKEGSDIEVFIDKKYHFLSPHFEVSEKYFQSGLKFIAIK